MEFLHRSVLLTALVCLVTCLPQAPANCLLNVLGKEILNVLPKVDTAKVKTELLGIKGDPIKNIRNGLPKVDTAKVKTELPGIKGIANLNRLPKVDTAEVKRELPEIKDVPVKENLNGLPIVDTTEVKTTLPGIQGFPVKENISRLPKVDTVEVKTELPGIKVVPGKENGLNGLPTLDTAEVKRDLPGIRVVLNKLGIGKPSVTKVGTNIEGLAEKKPKLPSLGISVPPLGAPAIPDLKLVDLSRRINKLESVLKLLGYIQVVGDKMIASSGKDEEVERSKVLCQAIGGRIATPMNEAENNAILFFLKNYNRYAYLGLKEGPIPGIFHYSNGIPVLYTNWRKNEPSGKGQERCVEMYTDGQWNDKGCNQKRLTVCEL